MYTDIDLTDRTLTRVDLIKHATKAANRGFGIAAPIFFLPKAREIIVEGTVSTVVDVMGSCPPEIRELTVLKAIQAGANAIDIPLCTYHTVNKLFKEINDDMANLKRICDFNNTSLRLMLEYRHNTEEEIVDMLMLMKDLGIEYVFPSTGVFVDDYVDNMLFGMQIQEIFFDSIKIITNGNIWQTSHIDTLHDTGLFGMRLKHSVYNTVDMDI